MRSRIVFLMTLCGMLLASCAGGRLSAEKAVALAKEEYARQEARRAADMGITNTLARGSVFATIRKAEVIANDGRTATVRLWISVRRELPPSSVDITVGTGDPR